MTTQFEHILNQRESLSLNMNVVFIITFIIMLTVSWKSKKIWTSMIVNFLLTIMGIFIAGEFFDSWWKTLYESATSQEDKTWIANHDSLIIIGVIMLFKGSLAYIFSFTPYLFKRKKNKSKV
jgi:hypothetical protein